MEIFSKQILMANGKNFVRPNLTANGTMGGDAFAVTSNKNKDYAYRAVNSNTIDYWEFRESMPNFRFYNPKKLKITKFTLGFTFLRTYNSYDVEVSAGDTINTQSYITIPSTASVSGSTLTITLTNSNYYNYYMILFSNYAEGRITDIGITATYE